MSNEQWRKSKEMMDLLESSTKKPYVSVYRPIAGWKPIMLWWCDDPSLDDGGFWEPWATYPEAFSTEEEAVSAAKAWALEEGVEYRYKQKGGE